MESKRFSIRWTGSVVPPETGRYEFDDARVLQIVAAAIFVLAVVFFLVREFLLSRRHAGL